MPYLSGSSGSLISAGTQVARDGASNGHPMERRRGDSIVDAYQSPVETFSTMAYPRDLITRLFSPNIRTAFAGLKQFSFKQTASTVFLSPPAIPRSTASVRSVRNKDVAKGGASTLAAPGVYVPKWVQ